MHDTKKRFVKKYLSEPHQATIKTDLLECADLKSPARYSQQELVELESRLNIEKSKLDRIYANHKTRSRWLRAQNNLDLYKSLKNTITADYGGQFVSNATIKYFEIFNKFPALAGSLPDNPKVFFNAELPGAALCAFNHYMNGKAYDWHASSLITPSEDNSSLGDTYGLYAANPDRWLMTADMNGDCTNIENLLKMRDRLGPDSPCGGVDLYSHDAGLDSSGDYNNQESLNMRLHLGCALAGLMTLKPGGAFIAKQYTFFKTFTWNLLILYSSMFQEFHLFKPLSSRPTNSEIYLIGIGYKGTTNDELMKTLVQRLSAQLTARFDDSPFISAECVKINYGEQLGELLNYANMVYGTQIEFLRESVELFEKLSPNQLASTCKTAEQLAQLAWWKLNRIPKIQRDKWLRSAKHN